MCATGSKGKIGGGGCFVSLYIATCPIVDPNTHHRKKRGKGSVLLAYLTLPPLDFSFAESQIKNFPSRRKGGWVEGSYEEWKGVSPLSLVPSRGHKTGKI